MKRQMLLLAWVVGFGMMVYPFAAQGEILLANSECVSMPTSWAKQDVWDRLVTSTNDTIIELLTLSPEEEREMANDRVAPILEKIACIESAKKRGWVAFRTKGIDRYFVTSPLNIVK
jgi:hypothetical protein